MKKIFTVKKMCRAGIIAALYVALTYAFGAISFNGILQIRPAEALCILPLFFPEAVPALFIGCILSNLASPFIIFDVPIGSAATLIAALGTYFAGRLIKNDIARFVTGGLFPVLVNAFIIPIIIVYLCGDLCGYDIASIAYWVNFASLCATEGLWVYALGGILYFTIAAMRKKGVSVFIDEDEKQKPEQEEAQV
ncbi:MAG: QueT transporter family protein [Clostridiales bacterium]|nr:QueT transporter family protein [Clostridiales bacterium]